MLIGTALEADPSSGVHLVLWGSMDPDSDQHIEEQLAHDAANVPPLEFTLPWEEAEQHRT
ncbi:hypothetical protein HaLaN_08750, partial [Haematococcus lacustris]